MSGEHGRQSSSDVAHEAEDTRAHLANTLEQLRHNLRPENVVDEVMSNARAGAASVADGLAGVAKANPLPSLLIAAGAFIVMGVMSRGGLSRSKPVSPAASLPPAPRLPHAAPFPPADGPGSVARGPRVDPGWSRDVAGRSVISADAATSDSASSDGPGLSHYVARDRREMPSKLSNLLDNQPLILGAIGLAVGAAIGAALPITDTEDQLMGETSHQLRQAATDVARHEVEGLRVVAGEAAENIKKAAADHGAAPATSATL